MRKPTSKNTNGSGYVGRLADYDLWITHKVRSFDKPALCPRCRTKNLRRRKDGVCLHRVQTEAAGESIYGDDESDCLALSSELIESIANLQTVGGMRMRQLIERGEVSRA